MNNEEKKDVKIEDKQGEEKQVADKEPAQEPAKLRELIIQTDGKSIQISKIEVTQLELREICRKILETS